MDNIAEQLEKIKIIDDKDIRNFKNYIYKKYPENTTIKNGKILSKAIHQIIYKKLEGLPEDFKLSIKMSILKNTLGKRKTSITFYDVFHCCIMDENLRTNFTEQLINWVNLHMKAKVEISELNFYLQSRGIKSIEPINLLQEKAYDDVLTLNNPDSINIKYFTSIFLPYINNLKLSKYTVLIFIFIISIFLCTISKNLYSYKDKNEQKKEVYISKADNITKIDNKYPNSNLPEYIRYKTINEDKLKKFLDNHNSLLAKEPYFSTILSAAKEFNLNPVVLFSITGQEQNFVPKDTKDALKIANNPFNVYHSWKEYNTDIKDSSSIAARTLIDLSKNIPKDADPFLWIGKEYAEDRAWGNGVKSIFKELNDYVK